MNSRFSLGKCRQEIRVNLNERAFPVGTAAFLRYLDISANYLLRFKAIESCNPVNILLSLLPTSHRLFTSCARPQG